MPYASVFPLVTTRALAREFTYEVDDGVGVGAIVRVPFGRSRARGIVVGLHDTPPPGVDARPVESVLGQGTTFTIMWPLSASEPVTAGCTRGP